MMRARWFAPLALVAVSGAACGDLQKELKQTGKDIDEVSENSEQIGQAIGSEAQRAGEKAAAVIDKVDSDLKTDGGAAPAQAPASDPPTE